MILASVVSYARDEWNDAAMKALARFAYMANQHGIAVYNIFSEYTNPMKRWSLYLAAVDAASSLVGDDDLVGIINPSVVATEEGIRMLSGMSGDLCGIVNRNWQSKENHFELCCRYSHVWNKGIKFWFDWHLVLWRNKFTKFLLPLWRLYFERLKIRTYLPLEDALNVALHHYLFFMDKSPKPDITDIEFADYDETLEHPISFVSVERLAGIWNGKEWVITEVKP